MLFSTIQLSSNLLQKVNGFERVLNEPNSMTCCEDVARFIDYNILRQRHSDIKYPTGIYNLCNPGMSSPYRIKQLINDIHHRDEPVVEISKQELLEQMNLQLTNTWIESKKLKSIGFAMPSIESRLNEMIGKSHWLKKVDKGVLVKNEDGKDRL